MTDMLRVGAEFLAEKDAEHKSSPVLYRRNGVVTSLDAGFGETTFESEEEIGATVQAHVRDFLFQASAFPYDEPERGDQVIADGVIYELLPQAGMGVWRWSDPYKTTIRVHTKKVGTE